MVSMDGFPDIKTYRIAKGLTQAEFAERVSAFGKRCSQSRVSQWESGTFGFTAAWATQVELATGGEVRREVLIFGAPQLPDYNASALVAPDRKHRFPHPKQNRHVRRGTSS